MEGNRIRWRDSKRWVQERTLLICDPVQLLAELRRGPDSQPIGIARAVLLGEGMHGKTHLALWLTGHPDRTKAVPTGASGRTIGFKPFELRLDLSRHGGDTPDEVLLTVIDCGGQHEQLQSHHNLVFRGSSRTLFILCVHAGKDFKRGNRADYYLRMLQAYHHDPFSDEPIRVIMVVTHGDGPRRIDLPSTKEFARKYPSMVMSIIHPYSNVNGDPIDEVQEAIEAHLINMSKLAVEFPASLLDIRAEIRRLFQLAHTPMNGSTIKAALRASITPDEFGKICAQCGVTDSGVQRTYLRELANLCDVVVPGLEDTALPSMLDPATIILNPDYVNRYVNEFVTNDDIRRAKGFMKEREFRELTRELSEPQRAELKQLLRKCLVVFDWTIRTDAGPGSAGMLVPDLLPVRSERSREHWEDAVCGASVTFKGFLGEWRIFELMAKHETMLRPLALKSEEAMTVPCPVGIFRNECMIEHRDCRALVQTDVIEMAVKISVRGSNLDDACHLRRALLDDLVALEERPRVEIDLWDSPRWLKDSNAKFVFKRSAKKVWHVAFGSEAIREISCHRAGFEYIARLLKSANRAIGDVELHAKGNLSFIGEAAQQSKQERLDRRGRAELRTRKEELESAVEHPNPVKALEAREELAQVERELRAAQSFGDRKALLGNPMKKNAQTAVDNAIKTALEELGNCMQAELAAHLFAHIVKSGGDYSRCYLHDDPPLWEASWCVPEGVRTRRPME